MRVCIVGPIPPPAGGMAGQTRQLVDLLNNQDLEVALVATNAAYRPAWVGRIPVLRALFRLLPYFVTLYGEIRRADVVHMMANSGWSWYLFAMPCIWVSHWLNTPVIVNYRGGHAESFFQGAWSKVRGSMKKAARIVVPSGFLQQVFARYDTDAAVIPNILDAERFCPASHQLPASLHLISTRNLEHIYGNDVILHAFAKLQKKHPEARLTVAGSGPQRAELEGLAERLAIADRVTFCGRLNQEQMVALYQSAHLMLNASRVDNSPNSLIEAMACGVPVVSSDVGGIPFLIQCGENGLLVHPDDADALAESALSLLDDKLLYARVRQNALISVERFHQDKVIAQWMALYGALCSKTNKAH